MFFHDLNFRKSQHVSALMDFFSQIYGQKLVQGGGFHPPRLGRVNEIVTKFPVSEHHFCKIRANRKFHDFSEIWYSGKLGIGKDIENFDKCFKMSESWISSG